MSITIRVDWTPPASLGVNSHRHWRGKHPDEQAAKEHGILAARSAVNRKPWTCPDMPVLVAVIAWRTRNRRKDADNALNSIKHLLDGVCEGLGIDDKRFVTAMAFQRIDAKKQGYIELTIRPATLSERRLAA